MTSPGSTASARPKLTRDQLAGIIRANIAAFKEDDSFDEYLTDLIIYLMEFEYAWPDAATRQDALERSSGRFEFIQQISSTRSKTIERNRCRVCGADLQGKAVCSHCLTRNRVE